MTLPDILEFDGPPASHIGGVPYRTLTSYGFKAEGECILPTGAEQASSPEDARELFEAQLAELIAKHRPRQLAWRRPREDGHETPERVAEGKRLFGGDGWQDGRDAYWVSARLALLCCAGEPWS